MGLARTLSGTVNNSGTILSGQPLVAGPNNNQVQAGGGIIKNPTGAAIVLAASGGAAIDPTIGSHVTVTPTAGETFTIVAGSYLQVLVFEVVTAGASSFILTFGTGFKSTGTLATGTAAGATFMVIFIFDGTNFVEISRTGAQ